MDGIAEMQHKVREINEIVEEIIRVKTEIGNVPKHIFYILKMSWSSLFFFGEINFSEKWKTFYLFQLQFNYVVLIWFVGNHSQLRYKYFSIKFLFFI